MQVAWRALARRVATRRHAFKCAELDFSGVGAIGHGFADELIRLALRNMAQQV